MGKRSTFDRVPRDIYDTPWKAVLPLVDVLKPRTPFIEPAFGEGALARSLVACGHRLVEAHDLPTDARTHSYSPGPGVMFITNPPFWGQSEDLHPLIENLSNQAPTWLLMSADWLFNQSSGPLTRRLRRIVAVGRVKWIPGSANVGMENVAWLLFDRPRARAGFFVGRQSKDVAQRATRGSARALVANRIDVPS